MSSTFEQHAALIDALGPKELRRRFNLSLTRLHNWRVRGVPHGFRPALARMARQKGVDVPQGFLDPPTGAAPAEGASAEG